jgi:hypothetical protein
MRRCLAIKDITAELSRVVDLLVEQKIKNVLEEDQPADLTWAPVSCAPFADSNLEPAYEVMETGEELTDQVLAQLRIRDLQNGRH